MYIGVETPVGHVTFTLSSIKANDADLGKNNISTSATGLTLSINDGSIKLNAHWCVPPRCFRVHLLAQCALKRVYLPYSFILTPPPSLDPDFVKFCLSVDIAVTWLLFSP